MIPSALLDTRPLLVAIAGPNGAGKTSFYNSFLRNSGLRLVNADVLAKAMRIDAYEAARLAGSIRTDLLKQRESFVLETVFSDPVGDKLSFLKQAERAGYLVIMFFIGNSGPEVSRQRVAIRVAKGGHHVPPEKLNERYPRIMANLKSALCELPHVWVYDNDNLRDPFRLVAVTKDRRLIKLEQPTPEWLQPLLALS